jgi:amino acid transporter
MDADLEKKRDPSPEDGSSSPTHGEVITAHNEGPMFTRIIDSFRQNPHAHVVTVAIDDDGKPLVNQPPAQPALAMKLKQRHLQMIAIGGSIGKLTLQIIER